MEPVEADRMHSGKIRKSLSFVMAGYNEEAIAARAICWVLDALESRVEDYELILVDDASTDRTLEIMKAAEKEDPHVRVLENRVNLNYGASVLRGLKAAEKDWLVYDAFDLEMEPGAFLDLFRNLDEENGLVVFRRESYPAVSWRKITSLGNRLMLRLLFPFLMRGTPVLNHTQLFRRSDLDRMIPLARSPVFFSCEMVFRGKLAGIRWVDVPIPFHSISGVRPGAFGHLNDILWALHDMLRFRWKLWWRRKDFR